MKSKTDATIEVAKKKAGRKPVNDKGKPIPVRLKADHLARLDAFAESKGIPRTSAIQLAIAELLERNPKS
jgi:hypothetical protein